ncbi:electron transport complex subunit RsxC [Pseudoalteromonas sp. SSDWG2]|uniref:electron transport complex subunit RsxC n=1 Tax=Pseudoalteromonas sp. SSDWG2 TaxID=3139391 RepID=UPI003BAC30EC
MDSLLERISRGELWQSPGGVHPPVRKSQSNSLPIHTLPLPDKIILPIKQHIGAQGKLLVNVDEKVLKGQALTKPATNWSVPVHAPTSGRIIDITPMPSAHPSALPEISIVIEPDGEDTWCQLVPYPNYREMSAERIIDILHFSGISGMGGAGFPTYIKASTKQDIDVLIINGAECEPYISADDVLMQAHSEEIVRGIDVLRHLLQPKITLIAIEDDKPKAIAAMQAACQEIDDIQVRSIPTKYPSGGEKQLIQILTSLEVPAGGIPADIGVLVQNVGTMYAVQQAVELGKPLIERVVTVTGETLGQQRNVWALLGTPVKHLLAQQAFTPEPMQRVIMGGPMMGFTLPTVRIPVVKTTNCILAPTAKEMPEGGPERACIRCSACADACPASLLPQQLQWFAKNKEYNKLEEHKLFDCIECGACAYVCPSEIPLVQYYRVAKAQMREQKIEQVKSDRAKERFEARKERLEREQEERRNRHKRPSRSAKQQDEQSKEKVAQALARVKAKTPSVTSAKDKVAEAIARAKAKKATGTVEPDNSEVAQERAARKEQARLYKEQKQQDSQTESAKPDDKKAAVAAAIARAKAKKASEQSGESATANEQSTPADDKKAAVAAAIARAKAKKAAQQASEDTCESQPSTPADDKKAAVAAAIARAKAKKAAQQASEDTCESEPSTPADDKKAAVAAAIARAKAKKAAKEAQQSSDAESTDAPSQEQAQDVSTQDKKKAAVAAAIARAKAKKAAKDAQQSSDAEPADAPSQEQAQEVSAQDKKKAAVAAAIARAKAKKAAREAQENSDQEDPS